MKYHIEVNGTEHEVDLVERLGELVITVDGKPLDLAYDEADTHGQVVLLCGGRSFAASIEGDEHTVHLTLAGSSYTCEIEDERERAAQAAARDASGGGGDVKAVMPGVVVSLMVEAGQTVSEGDPLLILEAMKMQNEIGSPFSGTVQTIHVAEGTAVAAGAKLISIEGDSESA